jgi:hypothetical protein
MNCRVPTPAIALASEGSLRAIPMVQQTVVGVEGTTS